MFLKYLQMNQDFEFFFYFFYLASLFVFIAKEALSPIMSISYIVMIILFVLCGALSVTEAAVDGVRSAESVNFRPVCSEHEWFSNHVLKMRTDDVCLEKSHLRQPLPVSDVSGRKWNSHGSAFPSEDVQIWSHLELITCLLFQTLHSLESRWTFHILSVDFETNLWI